MSQLKTIIDRQYLLAIIVIVVIDLFGFVTHIYVSNKSEGYAELINISGRQRMLSQRITLLIYDVNRLSKSSRQQVTLNELMNNIRLFEESHLLLIGKKSSHKRSLTKEILAYYVSSGLDNDVKVFINKSKYFALNTEDAGFNEFSEQVKGEFLAKLNDAVKQFEAVSDELNELQYIIHIILLLLSMINITLIALFILIPLRRTIVSHEDKLAKSVVLLEQESEYKSMFLANMSHELRTPLNGILGVTALLKSRQVDEELRQFIDIVDTSSNTLLGTIENILDLSKLEMEQVKFKNLPFSPYHLLESVFQTFNYYPNENPVKLAKQFAELPEFLLGDEQKIKQIINNLMSNAIKFTHEGEIKISSAYSNGEFEISVSDTGIGIDEAKLELIFEPFKQADASTNRTYGGTGLGLAISKQMTNAMGGDLCVRSKINQGTSFTLSLPLKETNDRPLQVTANSYAIDEANYVGTVLIVEDNLINYKVLAKMLEKMGLKHQHALDGAISIDMVNEYDFDLVLMDYHMPNMNGIDATKALLSIQKPTPPIVMLTADITESSKAEAYKAGVKDFLEKPVSVIRLKEVISRFLSTKPSEKPND